MSEQVQILKHSIKHVAFMNAGGNLHIYIYPGSYLKSLNDSRSLPEEFKKLDLIKDNHQYIKLEWLANDEKTIPLVDDITANLAYVKQYFASDLFLNQYQNDLEDILK